MNREKGKFLIEQKINDFYKNEKELLTKAFQETEARSRFIDPFFEALGWDFSQTNLKKQFWDIHREFSQKDNSSTKKPDYAFRIKDGNKYREKFFVEAKAPWVPLTDYKPVFQAKRYAFSSNGKTPIVILTDFEEFRVFNGLERPIFNNPLQGLLNKFDFKYTQYLDNWNLLYDIFSKEAVYSGSIDKLIKDNSKNTILLDAEFLKDITKWREILARNIALRNKELTVNQLNEAVQRILDRLIFIRNLEDREIEPEYSLLSKTKNKDKIYINLNPLFRRLDDDYNGLLFKPHFSEELKIDDKVINEIIKNMCYPLSPFQFDIIEPEILGRIYEKFLGSKIRLTKNHQAKVEEKPEVRHAGGVYYTPQHIVDYIVKNTVGEKVKEKSPEDIDNIKILDPACGSGSFLLGAFDYLIKYHEDWYANNKKKKYRDDYYETQEGDVKVTLKRKGEILINNIFGVDIDREASEVAIMSLYLKLLDEGFDKGQVELFLKGHILPDMTGNMKCGNSLVSTDFYKDTLFDDELTEKINPFDWQAGFSDIIKSGGFDIIIGNPPYIRVQELDYSFIDYCKKKYSVAWKRLDISILFIELANSLLKDDGLNGYITSNQFLSTEYGRKARQFLLKETKIQRIIDYGDLPVFQKALTYVSIFILGKGNSTNFSLQKISSLSDNIDKVKKIQINTGDLDEEPWILKDKKQMLLLGKLKTDYPKLNNYGKCWAGLFTGKDTVLMFEEKDLESMQIEKEILLPVIRAQDCSKYTYAKPSKYVIYPYKEESGKTVILNEKEMKTNYPKAYGYLRKNKDILLTRKDSRKSFSENKTWYSLTRFGKYSTYHKPKIVSPGEVKKNKFGLDETGSGFSCARVFAITIEGTKISIKTILGILNTKITEFYLHSIAPLKQGGYYTYSSTFIDSIPLPKNILNKDLKEISELDNYVDMLLENNKKLKSLKTDTEKDAIKRKNDFIESEIEELVYKLYELSAEEIAIIKNSE